MFDRKDITNNPNCGKAGESAERVFDTELSEDKVWKGSHEASLRELERNVDRARRPCRSAAETGGQDDPAIQPGQLEE